MSQFSRNFDETFYFLIFNLDFVESIFKNIIYINLIHRTEKWFSDSETSFYAKSDYVTKLTHATG